MQQERNLTKAIVEAIKDGNHDQVDSLRRQKVALATVNMNDGLESSRDSRNAALEAAGWFNQGDKNSQLTPENSLRAELTRLLGTTVKSGDDNINNAIKELYGSFENGTQREEMLRNLLSSQKTAAMQGDMLSVGIINEATDAEGNLVHTFGEGNHYKQNERNEWEEATVFDRKGKEIEERKTIADTSEGTRNYFASRVNVTKVDEVETYFTVGGVTNKDGKRDHAVVDISNQQIAELTKLYRGKDARSLNAIPDSQWSSWRNMLAKAEKIEDDTKRKNALARINQAIDSVGDNLKQGKGSEADNLFRSNIGLPSRASTPTV